MRVLVSIVLVPLLLLFFFNRIANWHYHLLPNGQIIEHSHPYSKSANNNTPYQNHSHTQLEIIVLNILTTLSGFLIFLFVMLQGIIKRDSTSLLFVPNKAYLTSPFLQCHPRRGPPSLSLS
jgi:hypothetical protein